MSDRTNIASPGLSRAVITVTNAQIKAAPNPGLIAHLIPGIAGQFIAPVLITFQNKFNATNWAITGQVGILYDNGGFIGGATTEVFSESALFGAVYGVSSGRVSVGPIQGEGIDANVVGSGISLYQFGVLGVGGDGVFIITIDYETLPA